MLSKSILKVAVSRSSLAPLTAVQTRGFARPGTPKGSKSGRGADSEGSERKREDKRLIEAFNKFIETAEASKRIKPDFTDEELAAHAAIHKRYHSELRKQQNAFNKDLADKAWLQQEAMRSLPLHLIDAASVIDDTPPPTDRPWPMYATPPIEGFNYKDYVSGDNDDEAEETEEGKEKE